MGFEESTIETFSVSAEERERIFEEAWNKGGGFRFMFETFCDIATDEAANEEAAKFIRRKIAEIVKDPETARKLTPTDLYARRPLCDSGYYETFNRPNVTLVNVKETPITTVTEKGIVTADGTLHELDVLVCATGFDAVDGNYVRVDIRGRDGQSLTEHWSDGPTSYLGMATSGFPNMFMILGPNGPFTNLPPTIETQVDWIGEAIGHVSGNDAGWIDVDPQTESDWTDTCARDRRSDPVPEGRVVDLRREHPGQEADRACSTWAASSSTGRSSRPNPPRNIPASRPATTFSKSPQRDDQRRNCGPDDGRRSRRRSPRPAQPHRDRTGWAGRAGPQDRHRVLHL